MGEAKRRRVGLFGWLGRSILSGLWRRGRAWGRVAQFRVTKIWHFQLLPLSLSLSVCLCKTRRPVPSLQIEHIKLKQVTYRLLLRTKKESIIRATRPHTRTA
jgi:hypothetical protein